MIKELIEPDFLKERYADVIKQLRQHADIIERSEAARRRAETEELKADDILQAIAALEGAFADRNFQKSDRDAAWLPRDPQLGIVQSALEAAYRKAGAVEDSTPQGLAGELPLVTAESLKPDWLPVPGRGLGKQMEEDDFLGWGLSFAIATSIKLAKGKHPFRRRPDDDQPVLIGDKVRLVLVADWASGVPRAQKIGIQMNKRLFEEAALDRDRHMIHLGDVYYAGRSFEYADHLERYWPVPRDQASKIGSWNLNANHDMFTGGHGYYNFLDRDERFKAQRGFSYFALENRHWLIAALDTSWESEGITGEGGGLQPPQAEWLMRLRSREPAKKLILLSHHQLFSRYETDSPLLMQRLEPILKKGVDAWFWGHEHRCAVYEKSHNISYPALIGHGGVPVYAHDGSKPSGVRFEYQANRRGFLRNHAMLGFAVVDLDDAQAAVHYVNEENLVHEGPHSF